MEEQQAAWGELHGVNSALATLVAHEDPESILPGASASQHHRPLVPPPTPSGSSVPRPILSNAVATGPIQTSAAPSGQTSCRWALHQAVPSELPVAVGGSCCPPSLAGRQARHFLFHWVFHIYAKQVILAGRHNPFILTRLGIHPFLSPVLQGCARTCWRYPELGKCRDATNLSGGQHRCPAYAPRWAAPRFLGTGMLCTAAPDRCI